MKVFFTSDQHFGHLNVIKYDQRPFHNLYEMTEELILRWNMTVSKNDIVWFLGDLSLTNHYDEICSIVQRLNGHKKMIRGNHDRLTNEQYYRMGFEFVSDYPVILKNHFILSHAPIDNFQAIKDFYFIYGHVHTCPDYKDATCNSTCVCCNRWEYKPIRIAAFDKYQPPLIKQ